MSNDLKNIIEAVLLAADSPVNVARIQSLFEEEATPEAAQIKECIEELKKDCEGRGIELRKIGSGYRFQTQEKYADYLRKLHATKPPRLSRALLETLAIVAYRQPVSRGDIEEVRGVAVSSDIMQRLIDREWIKQVGVRDVPGRPALFGTTPEFLSYFNLESLKDLPSLMEQRELGEIAGEMETPLPPEVLAALENPDGELEEIEGSETEPEIIDDGAKPTENQEKNVEESESSESNELEPISNEDSDTLSVSRVADLEEEEPEQELGDSLAATGSENEHAVKEADEEELLTLASKAPETDSLS
ncbi:MAG: SMC-Scp complex subunit ScpB [Acidiferrobacterales bacterium]|nr:SMC-Scp complex subunit ScpB [Acidiferrobacterales bacterium]